MSCHIKWEDLDFAKVWLFLPSLNLSRIFFRNWEEAKQFVECLLRNCAIISTHSLDMGNYALRLSANHLSTYGHLSEICRITVDKLIASEGREHRQFVLPSEFFFCKHLALRCDFVNNFATKSTEDEEAEALLYGTGVNFSERWAVLLKKAKPPYESCSIAQRRCNCYKFSLKPNQFPHIWWVWHLMLGRLLYDSLPFVAIALSHLLAGGNCSTKGFVYVHDSIEEMC